MFHFFPKHHHHGGMLGMCDANKLSAWNIHVWQNGIMLATAISLEEARRMVRNGTARVISDDSIEEIGER